MAKRKIRFTVLDLVMVLIVISVIVYSLFRNADIRRFNAENIENEIVVTLSLKGLSREYFKEFSVGDSIYISDADRDTSLGNVSYIRSAPAVEVVESNEGFSLASNFDKVDIYLDVTSKCLSDRNGFNIIDGRYISPGSTISGDNGRILFDCIVTSVKIIG